MSKYSELKKKVRSSIPNIHYYLESISSDEIHILEYEKNGTSYLLKELDKVSNIGVIDVIKTKRGFHFTKVPISFEKSKSFVILKSSTTSVISIDGNIGLLPGTSNCDFVFFNNQDFCFVELKLNASVFEERAVNQNRNKAVEQLKNTINHFDSIFGKNYAGLNLEAFISTPDTYPRKTTAWQSIEVKFLEDTGINLYESREYETQ